MERYHRIYKRLRAVKSVAEMVVIIPSVAAGAPRNQSFVKQMRAAPFKFIEMDMPFE